MTDDHTWNRSRNSGSSSNIDHSTNSGNGYQSHCCCCFVTSTTTTTTNDKLDENYKTTTYSCYTCCLKGLLHTTKTTSITSFQPNYDLIVDRPSLQKWWNFHHHHHSTLTTGNDTTTTTSMMMVKELIQVLQELQHQNYKITNGAIGDNNKATKRMMNHRITSVFLSMDVFQNRTNETRYRPQQQHRKPHQQIIRTVLQLLKESFPQLQSVHLYNGPPSGSTSSSVVHGNEGDGSGDDADIDDDDDDASATFISDISNMSRPQNRNSYHRWNRFNVDNVVENEEEEEDTDGDSNHMIHRNDMNELDDEGDDGDDDNISLPPIVISGSTLALIMESSTLQSIIVTRCLYLYDTMDISTLSQSLQNHPSLRSVHFSTAHLHPNLSTTTTTVRATSNYKHQFCMDPIMMALSSIVLLESLNITLAKGPRSYTASSSSQLSLRQRNDTQLTNTATTSTIMSPQCIRQLIAGTTINDLTLWECQLNGLHLSAISDALLYGGSCDGHKTDRKDDAATTSKAHDEKQPTFLQFISLRCNPNITCDDWCTFYRHTLPNCYSVRSIYNDHVCGLADCDPSSPVHGRRACAGSTREGIRFWDIDTTTNTTSDETSSSDYSTADAAANAELFLGLNSLGRGSIIQGTYSNRIIDDSSCTEQHSENDESLLDLLSDVTDTPSALYALIRSHPMMIVSSIRYQS